MNEIDNPEQKNIDRDEIVKRKDYLLEKTYDKYKMEIARKDRLESKAIGYYTIIGISFAAFLVVEPILFSRGYFPEITVKDILLLLNYLIIIAYLVLFVIIIVNLHRSYKPKNRPEFRPIENWDMLIKLPTDESCMESIKVNLTEIISEYEKSNGETANHIQIVNGLCLVDILLVVVVFIIFIVTHFI